MKRYAKLAVRLLAAAGIMAAAFAMTSWADDEDREKITSIKLNFSFDTYDREVTVDGEGDFYVDDYDVTTSGNTPKVKVYLETDDGYYFSSKSSSIFKLSGEGAKLSGTPSIVNDKTEMRVTVQLNDIDGWNDIDEAYWENDDTAIAHWTDTGSSKYQVRLYRNGTAKTSAITVHNNVYNFNGYIDESGRYTFKVRVDDGDSWNASDTLYVESGEVSHFQNLSHDQISLNNSGPNGSSSGQWIQQGNLWWYRNADGSYTTSNWQQINGKWYFFDPSGWMMTGWINWNNKLYYCDASGAMLTNTTTPDGFYVGPDGALVQGGQWIQQGDLWWYRNADGSYTTNNWQNIGGKLYFFDASGWMKTGWIQWGNKWYYCDASGAMLVNTTTPDGLRVGADGAWVQ